MHKGTFHLAVGPELLAEIAAGTLAELRVVIVLAERVGAYPLSCPVFVTHESGAPLLRRAPFRRATVGLYPHLPVISGVGLQCLAGVIDVLRAVGDHRPRVPQISLAPV